ncbi:MAG: hypothetical protein K2N78_00760 [Oscillospiraceae bacterium]|nr:hypothetical protein [Oscillospiraceae bacterium]
MKPENFALALDALLPDCNRNTAQKWTSFVSDCIDQGMYAYFIIMEDHTAAVEKWLDAVYTGLYFLRQDFGIEIATRIADLGCETRAVFPCIAFHSEMEDAAEILKNGGSEKEILSTLYSDERVVQETSFWNLLIDEEPVREGPEIGIVQTDISCGIRQEQTEKGYLLTDGTVLLESERDTFGRYRSGVGMDGIFLQSGKLYAPVICEKGQISAFQKIRIISSHEREVDFLTRKDDAAAIYRLKGPDQRPRQRYIPLGQLQRAGASPLAGNYDLAHIIPLCPGTDSEKEIDTYRQFGVIELDDIVVFKQGGDLTCWFVDMLSFSKLTGLLRKEQERDLADAEISEEQSHDGAPRLSVLNSLRQCQGKTEKSSKRDTLAVPRRDPER